MPDQRRERPPRHARLRPARAGALLGLLSCALVAFAVAPPAAGASPGSHTVPAPDRGLLVDHDARPAGARLDRPAVRGAAEVDPQMRRVLEYRPGAVLMTYWHADREQWTVHAREAGSTRDFARLTVADSDGRVTGRYFLPFDRYPPRLTERRAEAIARASRRVRQAAAQFGGLGRLHVDAHMTEERYWEVDLSRANEVKVRVDVSDSSAEVTGVWTGEQVAWKMARGERHAFGGDINVPWVWWPMFALFALVMLDPLRLWSLRTLDVAALLSFGVSHAFFDQGMIEWSVPLAVPPLLYLFVRMGLLYVRGVAPAAAARDASSAALVAGQDRGGRWRRRLALWPPTWFLVVLALFAAGVRYGINVTGSNVIDVGYAGVAGASDIVAGRTPYGNMPQDNRNGDTYGPVNYLAYVPAVLVWDDAGDDEWDNGLPAAHAVSIASDVLCVLALVLVGWRWMSRRAAALLACGWLVYPYTAFALSSNVNDLLVAALLLLGFAALPRAWLRGGLVALAAGVKFVPILALAPLAHAGTRNRLRQFAMASGGAVVVAVACAAFVASYDDGVQRFVRATWGFQYDRSSPFSPWGLYDWRIAQQLAQAALGAALLWAVVRPAVRDFRQVAAGAAAAMLGAQLVLQHWFYLYIPWFAGFVLIVLVAQRVSAAAPPIREERLYAPEDGAEHPPGRVDPGRRLVANG